MHSSLPTDLEEFHRAAKEFFDALPTTTQEGADNGFKCLTLMYFGLPEETSEQKIYEAHLVLKIATRKMVEHGFTL